MGKRRTDEEILASLDEKGTEELLERYKNLVRSRARTYYMAGADGDDLIQEGMIGLFKAIRDFRPERNILFRAFAEVCVERQLISAVKRASRKKHEPLNTYVSFSHSINADDPERTVLDTLSTNRVASPEEQLIGREDLLHMEKRIDALLSALEREILALYLEGKNYREIAERSNKSVKAVDNALQRIKKKLERFNREG